MQCPIDGETLLMSAREGVEIDYCPRCRGVWLDRGELDKIIERASGAQAGGFQPAANAFQQKAERVTHKREEKRDRDDYKDRRHKKYDSSDYYKKRKNKTKSFLKEIFDFD